VTTQEHHTTAQDSPTAEHPEQGQICYAGIPAFAVEHWIECGEYVFRSTEFELVVGDPVMSQAVDRFVEGADDLWSFLEKQEKLTENELELVSLLASRFRKVLHELDRREEKRSRQHISISLRDKHLRSWHPTSSTPSTSSRPLPV
jgi:hypothetical protein